MLDHDHRGVVRELGDQVAQLGELGLGQPAGRLVEQQYPRPGDEGAGERDPLAQAVRELIGQLPGLGRDAHPVEGGERTLSQRPFVAVGAGQAEQRRPEPGPGMAGGAGHDVLQHREPAEQANALQRAGDPQRGEPVRRQPGQ